LSEENLNPKHVPRTPVTEELEWYRKDGSTFWSENVFSFVRNSKGEPTGIMGVGRDITERKKAEEKLRQSEEHYHSLFDRMLDGVYLSTHGGRFVDVNPAFVKMFGYSSKQEMLDIGDIKKELYFSPEERGSHILDTDQEEVKVYRMRRKDGSEIWVEDHGGYVHDEQGNIIYHEGILRDITERKHAEVALRESEGRLRRITENMLDTVVETDLLGVCKYASQSNKAVLGYDPKDLVGKSLFDFVHPEDLGIVTETVQRAISTGRLWTGGRFECRYRHADGHYVWFEVLASIVRDEKGEMIGSVMGSRDITERKRAEEKVRESEEKFSRIFQSTPDAVTITRLEDGVYVEVNKAFTDVTGFRREEVIGRTSLPGQTGIWANPEDRHKFAEALRENGSVSGLEAPLHMKDDSTRVAMLTARTIEIRGELCVLTMAHDITERKRMEAELEKYTKHLEELVSERTRGLRESEEKYRELFEACPVSLWEEDFSAVKQFLDELREKGFSDFGAYFANHPRDLAKCASLVKVVNVNKATLNLYDAKSVDEIIGGLSGVLTEESNRAFVGEVVALVQGNRYYEAEFENLTLRGETRHCNVICAVVPGYEQSLAKVLISIVDLTPQKKLETELVKSQRLAAIGETAAMVGHDLRNPLEAIAGASYLLRTQTGDVLNETGREALRIIVKSIDYSDKIINDLLEYSGEIKLKPSTTNPKAISDATLSLTRIPENVKVLNQAESEPTIAVDVDKIQRVFLNLVRNAVDAMPQGGTLTISSTRKNGLVEFMFTDTGTGMPEEVLRKLWTPLFTTKAKGMGFGLATTKRIIEAHGGTVTAVSTPGKGSTFAVKLPLQPRTREVE
jgi:PAS domain S-box-containing protein